MCQPCVFPLDSVYSSDRPFLNHYEETIPAGSVSWYRNASIRAFNRRLLLNRSQRPHDGLFVLYHIDSDMVHLRLDKPSKMNMRGPET